MGQSRLSGYIWELAFLLAVTIYQTYTFRSIAWIESGPFFLVLFLTYRLTLTAAWLTVLRLIRVRFHRAYPFLIFPWTYFLIYTLSLGPLGCDLGVLNGLLWFFPRWAIVSFGSTYLATIILATATALGNKERRAMAFFGSGFLLAGLCFTRTPGTPTRSSVKVGLVQVSNGKLDSKTGYPEQWSVLETETKSLFQSGVSLVVWPETLFEPGYVVLEENHTNPILGSLVPTDEQMLLFGAEELGPSGKKMNCAWAITAKEAVGPYVKRKRVLGAEYWPFLAFLKAPFPGYPEYEVPSWQCQFWLGDTEVKPWICFEALEESARKFSKKPQIRVVLMSSSFDKTDSLSEQMLASCRLRAIELQTPVVVANCGGPSAIFDYNGQMLAYLKRDEVGSVSAKVGITSEK